MKRDVVGVFACAFALAVPTLSAAADYNVVGLGALGGSSSIAAAISSNGLVTGYATIGGQQHIFLYDGSMHDLGIGTASGVNASGMVVGTNSSGDAFLYDGTMHDLGAGTSAYGINNSGQIALVPNNGQGEIYQNGTSTPLPLMPGGMYFVVPYAINASGQAAGFGDDAVGFQQGNYFYAFFFDGTTTHDIGTHGETLEDDVLYTSTGYGINGLGHVVGTDTAFGDTYNGFLYMGGVEHNISGITPAGINDSDVVVGISASGAAIYTLGGGLVNLDTLIDPLSGWHLTEATAINDAGQIVGVGSFQGGPAQAVLLNPVPEPASFLLAALASLSFLVRFRQLTPC